MDEKIDRILIRGVANIIPGKDELEKALNERKLNIYLGIDPTAPKIHLGHAVPLIKLQKFAELGHNVTLLIGDFTALVGDTSDKDSERPILTPEEIEENFKTYKKQAEKILDFSKIKIVHNSEWLSKLNYGELLKIKKLFSVNDFISRELIRDRLKADKTVRLDETEYPIMQGYDSYFLNTDLQIGATDQTFNMQVGRTLQKKLRSKESFILATEFLMGTDGRKMSKSWGNAIWLDDSANDMYAKVMAINDDLIIQYFTLVTRVPNEEIEKFGKRLKAENPIGIKKELAITIVSELHSEDAAKDAAENFERTVQKHELPDNIPVITVNSGTSLATIAMENMGTASMSDWKRLVNQGGVMWGESKLNNPNEEAVDIPSGGQVLKIGKRNPALVKTSNER